MNIGKDLTPTSTQPATVHVPLATEDVRAIDIEVQAQALYNYCKSLYDGKIVVASGVTMLVNSGGAITCNGKAIFNGTGASDTEIADADIEDADIDDLNARLVNVTEALTLGTTGELTVPEDGNAAFLGRTQGRPRIYMADVATVTIDTTQADEFVLPDDPSATFPSPPGIGYNIVILRTTTFPIPRENETITLVVPVFYSATGEPRYSIRREDGVVICTFDALGGETISVFAKFRFSLGAWRLGPNSGTSFNSGTAYGVVPDAGAA
jgi:hypothetical protein